MYNPDLFIKMIIDSWQSQIKAFNDALEKLSDEQLMNEISPGRNRGIYLLGHLTAVHDLMLPLLRFEEATHPELISIFIEAPDKTVTEIPPAKKLREYWNSVNEKLAYHFKSLSTDEWFTRHSNVSEEDF